MRYRQLPLALLGLLLALFIAWFSWLAVTRHMMFRSGAMDLGYTTQVLWNTLHGRPFIFTTYQNAPIDLPLDQFARTDHLFAYHVELLLAPISLLYLIWADPILLLVLQAIGVALGAIPAYLLARRRLASDWAGLAFAGVWLMAPALQGAILSDFHAVTLTASLLMAGLWFLEQRRWALFTVCAALALLAKEDIPLLITFLGVYVALRRGARVLTFQRRRLVLPAHHGPRRRPGVPGGHLRGRPDLPAGGQRPGGVRGALRSRGGGLRDRGLPGGRRPAGHLPAGRRRLRRGV